MRYLAILLAAAACAHAATPEYSGELIFAPEKWHNHSSSVVELPNGDLLVVWFHGSGERTADDVLIRGVCFGVRCALRQVAIGVLWSGVVA